MPLSDRTSRLISDNRRNKQQQQQGSQPTIETEIETATATPNLITNSNH